MSRCLSFPPPDYVWNGVSGDALIDLLKCVGPSREGCSQVNIREKKKTENDERRKKRKREENAKKRGQYKKKMQKHEEISDDANKKSDEEKSSLTDEHAQPNSIGSLCYTSDGTTQSSSSRSKRKRDDDDLPCNASHNNDDMPFNANNSNGQAALQLLFKESFALATRNCAYLNGYCHSVGKEHDCTEFEVSQLSDQELRETKTMSEEVAMYRTLIETLDTTPLQYEPVDDEDQKWLVERRSNDDDDALKRLKTTSNNCSFGYSLNEGPRAQYIKEADIYALPYTIPF